jgi:hypothetical protein
VELLAFPLPYKWCAKFDLEGYVPTLYPGADLVLHYKELKHNEPE